MTIKPEVIHFLPQHLEGINVQDKQLYILDHLRDIGMSPTEYGNVLLDTAITEGDGCPCAWSYVSDEEILGCGGIVKTGMNHMAEAWCIFGKDFRKVARIAIKRIRRAVQECEYERVQAFTEVEFKDAQRFLEWLGFQEEGVLRKSGVFHQDVIMYSIIKEKYNG
jgi:RimJ/RimL family protein N-acetyltransferase